jgi:sugar phosphate isomerase/epimerase
MSARFAYALNASTVKTSPLPLQLEAASAAGFAGIELWWDDIDAWLAQGESLRELRRRLEGAGLAVPTVIYLKDWFDASDADYPRVREACRRRLAQAAEIGAPRVIAGPPAGRADVVRGAARYADLLEAGRREGSLPAMEFLGFVDQIRTLEAALDVTTRAADPDATVVLDPFHMIRGGGDFAALELLRPEQIAISHFNDMPSSPPWNAQCDADRVLPGEGCVDLVRYLSLLAGAGYRGFLSVEVFRADLWSLDPRAAARRAMDAVRRVAGV